MTTYYTYRYDSIKSFFHAFIDIEKKSTCIISLKAISYKSKICLCWVRYKYYYSIKFGTKYFGWLERSLAYSIQFIIEDTTDENEYYTYSFVASAVYTFLFGFFYFANFWIYTNRPNKCILNNSIRRYELQKKCKINKFIQYWGKCVSRFIRQCCKDSRISWRYVCVHVCTYIYDFDTIRISALLCQLIIIE